jgi:hypothetical protein
MAMVHQIKIPDFLFSSVDIPRLICKLSAKDKKGIRELCDVAIIDQFRGSI